MAACFQNFTVTVEPRPCAPASLAEQIRDAEADLSDIREEAEEVANERAEAEKVLADLKAKAAAEEAAKAKTYGQRVAEQVVRENPVDAKYLCFGESSASGCRGFADIGGPVYSPGLLRDIRRVFARHIDKAHADGRAEQRESDAALCDGFASLNEKRICRSDDEDRQGRLYAYQYARNAILGNK